jgi:hypothetical protein
MDTSGTTFHGLVTAGDSTVPGSPLTFGFLAAACIAAAPHSSSGPRVARAVSTLAGSGMALTCRHTDATEESAMQNFGPIRNSPWDSQTKKQ